jgi:hypothetical protein
MKNIIVFFLLLAGIQAVSQQESVFPFKHCNTITVNSQSQKDVLNKFAIFLQQEGYTIATINPETRNLITQQFRLKKYISTNCTINAFTSTGGTISISAERTTSIYGMFSTYKMKEGGSADGALFDLVNDLARKFVSENGYTITYSLH